jgi:hypothetical protein
VQILLHIELKDAQQGLPRYGAARTASIVLLLVRNALCEYLQPQSLDGRVFISSGWLLLRAQNAVDPWESHLDPSAHGGYLASMDIENSVLPQRIASGCCRTWRSWWTSEAPRSCHWIKSKQMTTKKQGHQMLKKHLASICKYTTSTRSTISLQA